MPPRSLFLAIHIAFGVLGLVATLGPWLSKKGGRVHRRSGWLMAACAMSVGMSAWLLIAQRFWLGGITADQRTFGVFLAAIALLTMGSAYFGVRVLKVGREGSASPFDNVLAHAMIVGGILAAAHGLWQQSVLGAVFPLAAVVPSGFQQRAHWRLMARSRAVVHIAHLRGMTGASISMLTAFVVTALPRVMGRAEAPVCLWFMPTLVFTPVAQFWLKRLEAGKASVASWLPL